MMELPKISVFSLGGTIASAKAGEFGVAPSLGAEELVAVAPDLSQVAEIETVSLRQVPSPGITLADIRQVADFISSRVAQGCDGVVITQGTDTLEEVAFSLDLLLDVDIPVVITAAMRNPTQLGSDGPANISAAVRVAASPLARGLGVLVVMNDEIHAARFVQKVHTQSVGAFRSFPLGPLGWVAEGDVRVLTRPVIRRPLGALPMGNKDVAVALLTMTAFDDGRLVRAACDLGFAGVVVQALGGGHSPPWVIEDLVRLAGTMPTVMVSRTNSGEILRHTYGFPGSETDLVARGLIPAGYLTGAKARVLLLLLLRAEADRREVIEAFQGWTSPANAVGQFRTR